MNNFRGFLVDVSLEAPSEPYFNGTEFSVKEKVVPTSVNYKVDDLYLLSVRYLRLIHKSCMILMQLIPL